MTNLNTKFSRFLFPVLFIIIITSCKEQIKDIEPFGDNIQQHIELISSDEFEGRAPATKGGRKTVEFLESEYKRIGLKPAVNGSYRQAVSLLEITGSNFSDMDISHTTGEHLFSFKYIEDMMIGSNLKKKEITVDDSELVFVGYGIVAPEYDWNDYEGLDLEGKTVVVLVNDPGFATGDESLFTGNAMTYYGRWTYKFEEAARQGAKSALIVHQDAPAGYGWDVVSSSWAGTQYRVANGDANYLEAEGWISIDAATALFANAGTSLEMAMERAMQQGFRAEPLGLTASLSFNNSFNQLDCHNVVGYLEGSEYPDETIIYMAHWDHLGKVERDGEVLIFNGAFDNATGVAGLIAMAKKFAGLEEPTKRSVVFLAVTAEESGLIGSKHYSENPLFPLGKTVAGINMDALNVYGQTHDVQVVGYGYTELDNYIKKHAKKQNRVVVPDPYPERGYYFRSDQFSMTKVGIPTMYAQGGRDFIGKDEEYSKMVAEDMAERYHQPTDVVHDLWRYDGIYQDLWLYYNIGKELANSDDFPGWKRESEFKSIREQTANQRQR